MKKFIFLIILAPVFAFGKNLSHSKIYCDLEVGYFQDNLKSELMDRVEFDLATGGKTLEFKDSRAKTKVAFKMYTSGSQNVKTAFLTLIDANGQVVSASLSQVYQSEDLTAYAISNKVMQAAQDSGVDLTNADKISDFIYSEKPASNGDLVY